jgi:hypothetical protein
VRSLGIESGPAINAKKRLQETECELRNLENILDFLNSMSFRFKFRFDLLTPGAEATNGGRPKDLRASILGLDTGRRPSFINTNSPDVVRKLSGLFKR